MACLKLLPRKLWGEIKYVVRSRIRSPRLIVHDISKEIASDATLAMAMAIVVRGLAVATLAEVIIESIGTVFGRHCIVFVVTAAVELHKLEPAAEMILQEVASELPELERMIS